MILEDHYIYLWSSYVLFFMIRVYHSILSFFVNILPLKMLNLDQIFVIIFLIFIHIHLLLGFFLYLIFIQVASVLFLFELEGYFSDFKGLTQPSSLILPFFSHSKLTFPLVITYVFYWAISKTIGTLLPFSWVSITTQHWKASFFLTLT